MKSKGFILLEALIVFTIGLSLLLTCLKTYQLCLVTMQKKLILEDALTIAEATLAEQDISSKLKVTNIEKETTITDLTLQEAQVSYNDKVIFTLAIAK